MKLPILWNHCLQESLLALSQSFLFEKTIRIFEGCAAVNHMFKTRKRCILFLKKLQLICKIYIYKNIFWRLYWSLNKRYLKHTISKSFFFFFIPEIWQALPCPSRHFEVHWKKSRASVGHMKIFILSTDAPTSETGSAPHNRGASLWSWSMATPRKSGDRPSIFKVAHVIMKEKLTVL